MITKQFLGDEVSQLGFGAMRLPVIDGNAKDIDQSALDQMVDAALEGGVNYFDTAYPYHANMSEIALGKSLSRYSRDPFFLATKFPGHQIADTYCPEGIFEEQLEKCGVDYFDFYLLHNIYEASIDVYMDEQWGIADYFIQQKKAGRIRHLGFSCHGRLETLSKFLDYGAKKYAQLEAEDPETAALFDSNNIMEFCQIQLNYLDWTLQKASEKCELLESLEIPVVVMEPLRGGKLAELDEGNMGPVNSIARTKSAVEWAFRWLQGISNVKVILSGMSSLQQVEDNVGYFASVDPLSKEEDAALLDIAETLKGGVPCTACGYCLSSCPMQIDIPVMMGMFNDMEFQTSFTVGMQMDAVPVGHRPEDCIQCGACTRMCPQGIDIPNTLVKLNEKLATMPKWADLCKQRAESAKASRS